MVESYNSGDEEFKGLRIMVHALHDLRFGTMPTERTGAVVV